MPNLLINFNVNKENPSIHQYGDLLFVLVKIFFRFAVVLLLFSCLLHYSVKLRNIYLFHNLCLFLELSHIILMIYDNIHMCVVFLRYLKSIFYMFLNKKYSCSKMVHSGQFLKQNKKYEEDVIIIRQQKKIKISWRLEDMKL